MDFKRFTDSPYFLRNFTELLHCENNNVTYSLNIIFKPLGVTAHEED
jgi:hypothetical protein